MHWARDTGDVRQSLTLLADALQILVKEGIEGDATANFPSSVPDITVMHYFNKTVFQNKISASLLILTI